MSADPDLEWSESIAMLALIDAEPRLTGRVGVGEAPLGPGGAVLEPLYVVLSRSLSLEDQERLTTLHTARRPSWNVHAVGESELAADAVMGWVDAQIRNVVPVLPGRRTRRIRRLERPGTAMDDTVRSAVVWSAIAVYSFEHYPTSTP